MTQITAIHRYPVKSMAGERLPHTHLTPHGLAHDRLYAFESPQAPAGMLRVSGPQRRDLLRYRAYLDQQNLTRVITPQDTDLAIDDPNLLGPHFSLTYEHTPQTDVRPLALISTQTIQQLAAELDHPLDPLRFRANLYLDCPTGPFTEDTWVGRTVRIGATATILIRERDPRCRFITYDPTDPQADPLFTLMKLLDRHHQGRAGVYATILTPGPIAEGDPLAVIP